MKALTKQQYELIAQEIKRVSDKGGFAAGGLWYLTYCLCTEFEKIDPRFKRDQFLKDCGVTE